MLVSFLLSDSAAREPDRWTAWRPRARIGVPIGLCEVDARVVEEQGGRWPGCRDTGSGSGNASQV